MNKSTFRRYGILSQVGLFVIFFLINFIENLPYCSVIASTAYALNYTFMVAAVVLIHYFYILPLYLKARYFTYFSSLFLVMTFFVGFYYLIDTLLAFKVEYSDDDGESFYFAGIVYDYLILIITTVYTSLYYFVEQWYKNRTTEDQLRNEKLQAELNFLKSQINPHFLFNTLNNIYSFAQTGNQKTAPMLERLSSILRFMVYDCGENRVGLSKEITALEDLLEIHKMKNSEQRNISLKVEGVKGFHLIAPLIIVNFVENACKHSDVISNPEGFLNISILVDDLDVCLLEISNTFKEKTVIDPKYGGLGLENIKKRLELQYGEDYSMIEDQSKGIYHLKLKIPLERKQ